MSELRHDQVLNNLGYEWFIKKIREMTFIDLNYYKRPQMERRINHLMSRNDIDNYQNYHKLLQSSPAKLKEFIDWITINVSEFYRDSDRWQALEKEIMPYLISKFRRLRIWSAGCSNGSEPYSIAILLNELGSNGHYILATDIDEQALQKAEKAHYKLSDLKNLKPTSIEKYFSRYGKGENDDYILNENIKKRIIFRKHNLFLDEFERNFHLIICRNVVIYFTNDAKDELYNKFVGSLVPDGIFFVGSTESLLNSRRYGLDRIQTAFYKKIAC